LGQAEIDSVSMTKAAVRAGLGTTIHPQSSWMDELQTGLVRASRVTDLHVNCD
jgi:DNA-binding transcriptional LysR family regulator